MEESLREMGFSGPLYRNVDRAGCFQGWGFLRPLVTNAHGGDAVMGTGIDNECGPLEEQQTGGCGVYSFLESS